MVAVQPFYICPAFRGFSCTSSPPSCCPMPHAIALPPLTHLTLPFWFAFLLPPELATTFPENSGYVAWVTAAFGPFWGFQVGAGWVA